MFPHLTDEDGSRLDALAGDLLHVLAPLAQVSSRETLDVMLPPLYPHYLRLIEESGRLILPSGVEVAESEFDSWVTQAYAQAREATESKADLFGEESLAQFLGALESVEALAKWGLRTEREVLERHDESLLHRYTELSNLALAPASYAQMSIAVLIAIVVDGLDNWLPEAIPILSAAADDYMTEVEDAFLSKTDLGEEDADTVALNDVRRELGL
jgi:hypothetical protein